MGAETLPLWLFWIYSQMYENYFATKQFLKSGEYLLDKENRLFYNENVRGSVWGRMIRPACRCIAILTGTCKETTGIRESVFESRI